MLIRTTNRLRRAVVLGLAAVALSAGVSAAPAHGAIGGMSAKLTIRPVGDNYRLSVDGLVRMTQAEAQGLIDSGHRIVIRVWGEDPISDDLRLGPYYLSRFDPAAAQAGHIAATPQGLTFRRNGPATRGQLNEDYGPPDSIFQLDEIYAGVRLVNSDGTTVRLVETNRQYDVPFEERGQVPDSRCPTNVVGCPHPSP